MITVSEKGEHTLVLSFRYNPILVALVKQIPDRKFNKIGKNWTIPNTRGCRKAMFQIVGDKITDGPDWLMEQIAKPPEGPDLVQDMKSQDYVMSCKAMFAEGLPPTIPSGLIRTQNPFTGEPQDLDEDQKKSLQAIGPCHAGAYFLDQGVGKTPVIIADMFWAYQKGRANRGIIITKNNVKSQICAGPGMCEDEATKFAPDAMNLNKLSTYAKSSAPKGYERWKRTFERKLGEGFDLLVVHHEALSDKRMVDYMIEFAKGGKTFLAIDESTKIKMIPVVTEKKGPENRSAWAIVIREQCVISRIMTGTPLIKRPLDAWTQLIILDRTFLPYGSYYAFKAEYAVMGGWEGKQVLAYKNIDVLKKIVDGVSFRCLKNLDVEKIELPPHTVTLPLDQMNIYKDMKKKMVAVVDKKGRAVNDEDIFTRKVAAEDVTVHSAPIVLAKMLRMQQIVSGFLPITEWDEEKKKEVIVGYTDLVQPHENVKLLAMMEIIRSVYKDRKLVVWSRFKRELDWIEKLLIQANIGAVRYDGSVKEQVRQQNIRSFREDSDIRVFFGTAAAAGTGTNLQSGSVMVHVSNTFATEDYVQSQDRIHRKGQKLDCYYHNIVAQGTVDSYVLGVIANNRELSDAVMGDTLSDIL